MSVCDYPSKYLHRRRQSTLAHTETNSKTRLRSEKLRIRTEPDCHDQNADAIGRRISQIKSKYNISTEKLKMPLSELNHQQIHNTTSLRIKQVDSPINSLNKENSKQMRLFSKLPTQQTESFQASSSQSSDSKAYELNINNDSRINNIDKINRKIKSILDNFDIFQKQLLGYGSSQTHKQQQNLSTKQQFFEIPNRGKFDLSKHAFHNIDRKPNLKTGKIQAYPSMPDKRTSVETHQKSYLERLNQSKDNSEIINNSSGKFKRFSDTDEKSIVNTKNYSSFAIKNETSVINYNTNSNNSKPKDQALPNRNSYPAFPKRERPYLQPPIIFEKTQIKRLYQTLKKQVELDQQYRNKKYAFKQMKNESKLFGLLAQFANLGIKIDRSEQLAAQMKISEEQYNPFYTCRTDCSYNSIANAYLQAKNHWQRYILGQFNEQKLIAEGFREQTAEFDRKGHLGVEDLVQLLNLEADTFVRNRDLILIHRRFSTSKLTFSDLMKQLCRR